MVGLAAATAAKEQGAQIHSCKAYSPLLHSEKHRSGCHEQPAIVMGAALGNWAAEAAQAGKTLLYSMLRLQVTVYRSFNSL